eukprot:c20925_g1_i3 orf=170-1066(+)
MMLIPSMPLPIIRAHSRPYWFRMVGLVSLWLAALSGMGFLFKRVLLQKMRWWIRRLVLENNLQAMQSRNTPHEVVATMIAVAAVKAASSATAEVSSLSRVILTIQAEGKHCANKIVSALQAQSSKLTKVEIMMRGVMEEIDRQKQLSATNGMPVGWLSSDKRYKPQDNSHEHIKSAWKGPFSNASLVSNARESLIMSADKDVETPQSSTANSTPQSASFLEVMAMLERGETPPGIKKINDRPPIPNQLPSKSYLRPKPKPWETEEREKSNTIQYLPWSERNSSKKATSVSILRTQADK